MDEQIRIRKANSSDKSRILSLYKEVATHSGGILRKAHEITGEYVDKFMNNSLADGIILVAEDTDTRQIVAELHTRRPGVAVFSHVLGHLTIVVHPSFQRKGIGKGLFTALFEEIKQNYPHILRVELVAKEGNSGAVEFYKKLGFVEEGRMEKRILRDDGTFEADIPMAWFNPDYKSSGDTAKISNVC
ncbi:GNAT family N-acetyltransferase [Methanolobus sp. ZRKC3]|uniref:GNAT family N-acetyltransferase n=1 Tax=Methanolobus sp. ZRKC3 TaxID=3125786 RepID=UPI00324C0E92